MKNKNIIDMIYTKTVFFVQKNINRTLKEISSDVKLYQNETWIRRLYCTGLFSAVIFVANLQRPIVVKIRTKINFKVAFRST